MTDFGLRLTCEFVGMGTWDNEKPSAPHSCFEWRVTLHNGNLGSYTVPYRMGLGHAELRSKTKHGRILEQHVKLPLAHVILRAKEPLKKHSVHYIESREAIVYAPTLRDVLHSLQLDSSSGEHLLFEDFADEFGYDPDSRKAEATWRACQATRGYMRRLLGAPDFEAFMAYDFDSTEAEVPS